jgi:CBS domain containing-hemolysin-like protein
MFEGFFEQLPFLAGATFKVGLAGAIALTVATYIHVVVGEMVPKALGLNHPETMARWLSPPLLFFAWLVKPFTWLLNESSRIVLRLFGEEPPRSDEVVHSPEELRIIVEQSHEGGQLPTQDADMIDAVLEFSEKNASEVMTPRTEVVALPVESTLGEVIELVEESGFTRYPVYDDTIDNIIGIILAKDLIRVLVDRSNDNGSSPDFSLRSIVRPVHVVPGSREVEDVLADFKRLKEHMAVVLDEYGGTAGIVTMEDLLEEIVGEILDEYDEAEQPTGRSRGGELLIPGSTHIGEINERYGLDVPDAEYTTIGGYVFGALGRLPVPGDRVTSGGAVFTVHAMDGRRIDMLSVDLHSAGDRRGAVREEQTPTSEATRE